MDDLWGLKGQSAWDGGFFGVIGWAVPMLLGTIVYDIMASHTPLEATARMLALRGSADGSRLRPQLPGDLV